METPVKPLRFTPSSGQSMASSARYHPIAERELQEAVEWYASVSPATAVQFLDVIEATVSEILEAPFRWPEFTQNSRRRFLGEFPYWIVYRVDSEGILVVAIAHARRGPQYWSGKEKI